MRTENPNDCRINSAGAEKRICPGGVYGDEGKNFPSGFCLAGGKKARSCLQRVARDKL